MPRFALRYLGHRPGASLGYFTGAGVTLKFGDVFDIDAAVVTVGRRETADLRVASSSVAPAHARLWVDDGTLYLVDLPNHARTRVNEVQVPRAEQVKLVVGDYVTIADGFDFQVIDRDQAAIKS